MSEQVRVAVERIARQAVARSATGRGVVDVVEQPGRGVRVMTTSWPLAREVLAALRAASYRVTDDSARGREPGVLVLGVHGAGVAA